MQHPVSKFLGLTAALITLPMTLASAGDIQGDAYSCDELWQMRNQIYKNAGYCFTSNKAIAAFGNAGCRYHSTAGLPLSKQDRIILRDIKRSAARQGC